MRLCGIRWPPAPAVALKKGRMKMSTYLRPGSRVLAVLAAVATLLAACGGTSSSTGTGAGSTTFYAQAQANIQKQEKILKDPSYVEKVSAAVQEGDQKRLADAKQELQSFEETIKQFETLKLE